MASAEPGDSPADRGEYLLHAAGCSSCHTDEENQGEFLTGGRVLKTAFGIFYTPNITPHKKEGIGGWSDADFIRAMKAGISPEGHNYYPAFPYTAYAGMRREDLLALKAYLDTVPPAPVRNKPHDLSWYLRMRLGIWIWKAFYFEPGSADDEASRANPRGAYLVRSVAHCGECHTPRGRFGGLLMDRLHAGNRHGPEDDAVPNITPDRKSGIGKWSRDDLIYYLKTGATPGGDYAGGAMALVIDNGTSHLTDIDLGAIADYVLSLPAIKNASASKKTKPRRNESYN